MKSYGGVGLTTITWPTVLPAGPASVQSSSSLPKAPGQGVAFTHAHQCESRLPCMRCKQAA